jgi:type II protein arginine methyltransferase
MRLRTPPWILLCDTGPIPGLLDSDIEKAESLKVDGSNPLVSSNFPSLSQAASQPKKHHDPAPHLSYMRNLQQRQPPRTPIEVFGVGYQDYLQAPLQPLTVNLESITYEVFEKDPIKYEWYERAISQALGDWVEQKKPTSSPDGRVVVAVVGAGRGPLVTRALRASMASGVKIEIWAIEKNPNAFVLLQRHNDNIWNGAVHLVKSDMRSWKGPNREMTTSDDANLPTTVVRHTPVDILVSELLGSFGDNELSPECLDGVTHLLNPVHGISIPASYSAHLTPISAPRLYADISAQKVSNPTAPETPYVVMLHAIDYLSPTTSALSTLALQENNLSSPSAPLPPPSSLSQSNNLKSSSITSQAGTSASISSPHIPLFEPVPPLIQAAWSFSHPNPNAICPSTDVPGLPSSTISNEHNARYARLAFPSPNRGVCHGLGGYFETVLYNNIELSTNPVTMDTKSNGMISWFPIYFPLKVLDLFPFLANAATSKIFFFF